MRRTKSLHEGREEVDGVFVAPNTVRQPRQAAGVGRVNDGSRDASLVERSVSFIPLDGSLRGPASQLNGITSCLHLSSDFFP